MSSKTLFLLFALLCSHVVNEFCIQLINESTKETIHFFHLLIFLKDVEGDRGRYTNKLGLYHKICTYLLQYCVGCV